MSPLPNRLQRYEKKMRYAKKIRFCTAKTTYRKQLFNRVSGGGILIIVPFRCGVALLTTCGRPAVNLREIRGKKAVEERRANLNNRTEKAAAYVSEETPYTALTAPTQQSP